MKAILKKLRGLDDTQRAFCYIGIAALLYSLIPLAVDYAGSTEFPLTVGAGFAVGTVISSIIIRGTMYSNKALSYKQIYRRCRETNVSSVTYLFMILLVAVSGLDFVLFTSSTSYVDTAVSAALFEIWPFTWFLWFIYADRRLKGAHEKPVTSWMSYLLMGLGMPAIALVILSSRTTGEIGLDATLPVTGIVLAICAPVVSSLGVFCFLFSDRVVYGPLKGEAPEWQTSDGDRSDRKMVDLSVNLASFAIGRTLTIPVAMALSMRESGVTLDTWSTAFAGGTIAGIVLHAPAATIVRRAHTLTTRREIISLQYLSPILALGWLAATLGIDVYRIDFLIFGTVSIVMLNMLINVDPEVPDRSEQMSDESRRVLGGSKSRRQAVPLGTRYRLKALVISLLSFGMFVYFRDEILQDHDFSWTGGSYWSILAVGSTVFALLLAFRLTRVEALLLAEDHRTLDLVRRIEMLPNEFFIPRVLPRKKDYWLNEPKCKDYLIDWIRSLNRATALSEYRHSYNRSCIAIHEMLERIEQSGKSLSDSTRNGVAHIRAELDALALGRQYAREFAERIALWLIGSTIVALCLAVPPQVSNWSRLLSDIFAIVLASIVLFLLVHLADVRRSRTNELLMDSDPAWRRLPEGLYIRFSAERDIRWRRIVSGFIIFVIVACIVVLLAWRRLGGL